MTDKAEPQYSPEDESETPDEAVRTSAPIDRERIKQGVKSTGRGLWALIGVMATLGGVLGLFQFLNSSNDAAADHSDKLLIAMVAEGVISDEQAGNLAKVLSGSTDDLALKDSDTLKAAVESQDKDAIIAMARMLNSETYTEGLDLLEASAETSEDWLQIAELSWGRDDQRCLRATEQAVKLDPDNFRAMTLLIQAQAGVGDYKKATRSAETARMLARTPLDQLMAEKAVMNVAMMGADTKRIENELEALEDAIEAYRPTATAATFTENLPANEVDKHPAWIFAVIHQVKVGALARLERSEEAIEASLKSTEWFERLQPYAGADGQIAIRKRKINNLRGLAFFHGENEDNSAAFQKYDEIIAEWESLIALGDGPSTEALALEWASYGQAAYRLGDKEKAYEAYKNGQDTIVALAANNPDSEEWQKSAELYETLILFLESEDGDSSTYKASYENKLKALRQDLVRNPREEDLRVEFQSLSHVYAGALMEKLEANADSLAWHTAHIIGTAADIERAIGANYYSYMLEYQAEYMSALADENREDIAAAKAHYNTMRDLAELVENAPDIDTYDAAKAGAETYALKLGIFYKLALFEDNDALQAARSGLTIAEGLDDAGKLQTTDQYFLTFFSDRIEALEAGAASETE